MEPVPSKLLDRVRDAISRVSAGLATQTSPHLRVLLQPSLHFDYPDGPAARPMPSCDGQEERPSLLRL